MTPRPLCRCCGKPIPKRTVAYTVYLTAEKAEEVNRWHANCGHQWSRAVAGPLHNKAECQAKVNGQVVSVSYGGRSEGGQIDKRRVGHFTVWDGESYADEFFCKGSCATRFAYVMARAGRCTNLYSQAVAAL